VLEQLSRWHRSGKTRSWERGSSEILIQWRITGNGGLPEMLMQVPELKERMIKESGTMGHQ
jgi:hypothetical protein